MSGPIQHGITLSGKLGPLLRTLVVGSVVRVNVLMEVGAGRYLIELAGHQVQASTSRTLLPGQLLAVRVKELGRPLVLEWMELTPGRGAPPVGAGTAQQEAEALTQLATRTLRMLGQPVTQGAAPVVQADNPLAGLLPELPQMSLQPAQVFDARQLPPWANYQQLIQHAQEWLDVILQRVAAGLQRARMPAEAVRAQIWLKPLKALAAEWLAARDRWVHAARELLSEAVHDNTQTLGFASARGGGTIRVHDERDTRENEDGTQRMPRSVRIDTRLSSLGATRAELQPRGKQLQVTVSGQHEAAVDALWRARSELQKGLASIGWEPVLQRGQAWEQAGKTSGVQGGIDFEA